MRALLLAALALAGCQTLDPPPLVAVDPDDRLQVVYAPWFPESSFRYQARHYQDGARMEIIDSGASNRRFEAAYLTAGPGLAWRGQRTDPTSFAKDWSFFVRTPHTVGAPKTVSTPFGSQTVHRISTAWRECVAWHWYFDERFGAHDYAGKRSTGYFCTTPATPLTDAEIDRTLAGYGIRGIAVPKSSLRS